MAFFDLSGTETLRIDEFTFGVEFFTSGNRLKECMMLFQDLDVNQDGQLDEVELDYIFSLKAGDQNSPMQKEMQESGAVVDEQLGNYIIGGYNTYNKQPLGMGEMLQLPNFASQLRNKMEMRRRGKEVGRENSAQVAFMHQ